MAKQPKKSIKRIAVDMPLPLYQKFLRSPWRVESATDAEGVRACIKHSLTKHAAHCQQANSLSAGDENLTA